jgi:hypothetical protein
MDNATAPLTHPESLRDLLAQRWQARQDSGNKDALPAINAKLLAEHGVRVYGSLWTRQAAPPLAYQRKFEDVRRQRRIQLYGPTGHPFQRVGRRMDEEDGATTDDGAAAAGLPWDPLDCSLLEPDIHESLVQLTDFRARGKDERADALHFELSLHGVRVQEGSLQWTVDPEHEFGDCSLPTTSPVSFTTTTPPKAPWTYGEDKSASQLDESEIDQRLRQRIDHLVHRRLEAVATARRQEAQCITWELIKCYRVQVDDGRRTWWVMEDDQAKMEESKRTDLHPTSWAGVDTAVTKHVPPLLFVQTVRPWITNTSSHSLAATSYRESSASLGMEHAAVQQRVRALLQERIHKREESKYVEADAIRRELWYTYVSHCNTP